MIEIVVLVSFIVLCVSHYLAFKVGFGAGSKINEPIEQRLSKPTKTKDVEPYYDGSDPFNDAVLD